MTIKSSLQVSLLIVKEVLSEISPRKLAESLDAHFCVFGGVKIDNLIVMKFLHRGGGPRPNQLCEFW